MDRQLLAILSLAISTFFFAASVLADIAESRCELWQQGKRQAEHSGDCLFSQRQGFIGLTLRDNSRIDLSPTGYMTYLDEAGQDVQRHVDDQGVNTFIWEDRKIKVTFGRASKD